MKDIPNYEGRYAITESGEVWSYLSNKFLKPILMNNGYLSVDLCKNGKVKKFRIHRLVAEAYLPNPDGLPQVNHKDEVKTNNCVNNLEWCTGEYNINYGTGIERSSKARRNDPKRSYRIKCIETGEIFESLKDCERKTGLSNGNLSQHLKGITKRSHVGGYTFERIE